MPVTSSPQSPDGPAPTQAPDEGEFRAGPQPGSFEAKARRVYGALAGLGLKLARVLRERAEELAAWAHSSLEPISRGQAPPPLPPRLAFLRRHAFFLLTVALPTLLAAFYFLILASNIYVSESRFVVRTPNKQTSGGLSGILQGAGFSGLSKAPEDVHTVSQYIMSRDAVGILDERLDLRSTWGSWRVDFLRRFAPFLTDDSREALFEYYPRRVNATVDPSSGITTLRVEVFSPEQAVQINGILLGEAERLVNLLNNRARGDLIKFAENEVKVAEDKAKAAASAVSNYRNSQSVVDPVEQTKLHYEQISRLQAELVKTQAQLTQLKVFAPDSPHPPALELRATTLESEIAKETEKITGGDNSLASKAAEYERLALEREFADKQLASALVSLELARNEAQRQQLYLETVAKPSLPDGPTYPRRLRGILTTFVLGLVAWGIASMLVAGVREHKL